MKGLHGGNIAEIARGCNIAQTSIVDFSASINPLGMPPAAKEAYLKAIDSVKRYPDNESFGLIRALSMYHDLPSQNILAGNGSTEFIYLIPRILRPERSLVVIPTFSEYDAALRQSKGRIDYFELREEEEFMLDISQLLTKLRCGYDSLWIGNPGNPTGGLIGNEKMTEILMEAERLGITCIIDEAFMDFSEEESIKGEVANLDNLIVLRSMTKFFALAGLRVGYIIGSENLIGRLKNEKEPWSLNSPGQATATASLADGSYREESLKLIEKEREFLYEGVRSVSFLKPFPSRANFILSKLEKGIKSGELQKALLKKFSILVRDCGNFHGLDGEFIRMAVNKRRENTLLLKALRSCNL